MRRLAMYVFPVCLIIIGIVFAVLGVFEFGFWDDAKGPMGGFYPTLVSILLIAMSIVCLTLARDDKDPKFPVQNLLVIFAVFAIFCCTFLIGMFPSIFLCLVIWLRKIEKYSWRYSVIFALVTVLVFYGVFGKWLAISFPNGLLGDLIFG